LKAAVTILNQLLTSSKANYVASLCRLIISLENYHRPLTAPGGVAARLGLRRICLVVVLVVVVVVLVLLLEPPVVELEPPVDEPPEELPAPVLGLVAGDVVSVLGLAAGDVVSVLGLAAGDVVSVLGL